LEKKAVTESKVSFNLFLTFAGVILTRVSHPVTVHFGNSMSFCFSFALSTPNLATFI